MAPVRAMLVRLSEALPLLVRVMVWGVEVDPTSCEAKVSDGAESEMVGAAAAVPVVATVVGDEAALEAMRMAAVRVPAAVGLKVTVRVQWAEAASAPEQALVRV